jgi:hypothetical protein
MWGFNEAIGVFNGQMSIGCDGGKIVVGVVFIIIVFVCGLGE